VFRVAVLVDELSVVGLPADSLVGAAYVPANPTPETIIGKATRVAPGTWIEQNDRGIALDNVPLLDTNGYFVDAASFTAFNDFTRLAWWGVAASGAPSATHVRLNGMHFPALSGIFWNTNQIPAAAGNKGPAFGLCGRIF
jgi:hypothetical protein